MAAAATARRSATARTAPARRTAPATGRLIPVAVGRTAVAVGHIPDTRAIVGLARGRAWIALLGVLLIGIVGLNVATLGLTANAGKIEEQIRTLEQESSVLRARLAQRLSSQRVEAKAAALGLAVPSPDQFRYREAGPEAVREAARRLAAASG